MWCRKTEHKHFIQSINFSISKKHFYISVIHFYLFCYGLMKLVYLFKVNNRNSRKRCLISSELTIKTPDRRQ